MLSFIFFFFFFCPWTLLKAVPQAPSPLCYLPLPGNTLSELDLKNMEGVTIIGILMKAFLE